MLRNKALRSGIQFNILFVMYIAVFWPHCLIAVLCVCLQTVEIPILKETRKVKSMQVFKKPVDVARQVGLFAVVLVLVFTVGKRKFSHLSLNFSC